ncbi:MAG: 50S ribosomal protein L23 [Spirochaetaceae bacterium]
MDADKVIIEPVLTEKANELREREQYVFRVDPRANKIQIKAAVRELFGVHPVACNVLNVSRKPKRLRYKQGYTSSWKKAIVTLSPGETIGIFEGA